MSKYQELPIGRTCLCVPLRQGLALCMTAILLFSLAAVVSLVTEDTRASVGGYSFITRYAVVVLGCLGTVFASVGLIGVHDNHESWVRTFAHFLVLRVMALAVIIWLDYTELKMCESLTLEGKTTFTSVDSNYYNEPLAYVALSGACNSTLKWYLGIGAADVLLCVYGAIISYRWCYIMDSGPNYQIALGENQPLRIYTDYANTGAVPQA